MSFIGLKHREDVKLLEGVRLQAIEKRSQPLLEKLESVKSNDELKSLRRQVSQLRCVFRGTIVISTVCFCDGCVCQKKLTTSYSKYIRTAGEPGSAKCTHVQHSHSGTVLLEVISILACASLCSSVVRALVS